MRVFCPFSDPGDDASSHRLASARGEMLDDFGGSFFDETSRDDRLRGVIVK